MPAKYAIAIGLVLCLCCPRSSASTADDLNSIVFSQNYLPQFSRWPSKEALVKTSKIQMTFSPSGTWDFGVVDDEPHSYLSGAYIWIGGILDDDTLVSSGAYSEVLDFGWVGGYNELVANNFPASPRSVYPAHTPGFETFVVHLDDERRQNLGYPQWDYFRLGHQPMHLSVALRLHTKNEFPFKGIALLDFTITNDGNRDIKDAYVGLQFNGEAYDDGDYYGWDDDLVGSSREIHTAYAIDNDGNPDGRTDNPVMTLPHGVGIRPVYTSKPSTDTNFNWWLSAVYDTEADFAPRMRGTPSDPFRDYRAETYGHPNGDVNRYYLLRHREWDFDQVMSAVVGHDDSLWNTPPDGVNLVDISRGNDTEALLSIGPFQLPPDSSLRVIYAVFAFDLVHTDWMNSRNLRDGFFEEYYSHLDFVNFHRAAGDALSMGRLLIDPLVPPLNFRAERVNLDSAWLSWESACFDEVTGYALYIRPARDRELLNPVTVLPTAVEESWSDAVRIALPPQVHQTLVTDLEPGRPYLAALAHITSAGEGNKTDPIVIGTHNEALIAAPPIIEDEFLHARPGERDITLSWIPSPDSAVKYYKIYKTCDSSLAANRLRPFWSDDSSLVPYKPIFKAATRRGNYWYYETAAYDSVSSSRVIYTDHSPDTTSFYWLSAVTSPGFESEYSSVLQVERTVNPTRDILLVYGSPLSDDDYVVDSRVRQQLEDVMGGYVFDVFDWSDTNQNADLCPDGYCVDWQDFARYELIVIQEYPSPRILPGATDPENRLLNRLLQSGRTIAYFGTPPGNTRLLVHSQDSLIRYSPTSFENQKMGLDSLTLQTWQGQYNVFGALDTLAGFAGADPLFADWPAVNLGDVRSLVRGTFTRAFAVDSVLPHTPAFYPQKATRVLYSYLSGYPSSSRLNRLPCGVATERENGRIFTFSFPLWSLDDESGMALIDRLMQEVGAGPSRSPVAPNILPSQFTLQQSYPNPFNSSTIITFDLIYAQKTALDIFNVCGEKIRSLVSERTFPPGVHRVEWDGRNDDGTVVASGVYFYRLQTDGGSAARRMTLIK